MQPPAPGQRAAHPWSTTLLALLGTLLLFLSVAHGNLESRDSAITMHAARALWHRGDSGLRPPAAAPEWLAEGVIAGYVLQRAAAGVHEYGKQGKDTALVYVWFPIGHVWLMAPCVALGDLLHRRWPDVEPRYRNHKAPGVPDAGLAWSRYPDGQFVFAQAVIAMLLPAAFGTLTTWLVWLIARAFGSTTREALLCTIAVVGASQCFPLVRETLSDGPGLAAHLLALLVVVRAWLGRASSGLLVLGGFAAGAAVLLRYQAGTMVPVLGVVLLVAAVRDRRPGVVAWFALGGLPCLLLLLAVNHARFGSALDTGYPAATTWFNYPPWLGLPKLCIAAGKGILWFSPLLWLALPSAFRQTVRLRWLALALFAIPLAMFSCTLGWQSGQCWGARYVTPGVVSLLALVLPQSRPWRSSPRLFAVLLGLGLLVNLTSLLAPTRGHNQLAGQAVEAMYDRELQQGRITAADRASVDPPDHFFFLPRFSPLHANWSYAWQSLRGGFEAPDGSVRNGAATTILPLFGIDSDDPARCLGPVHWEDRQFRHLWWRFWGDLLAVPSWLLLSPPLAVALLLLGICWRRLSRS